MGKYRQQILATSRALILEKGLNDVSMRDVIKATGLSAGTLYREIRNKDDLLLLMGADNIRLHILSLPQARSLGLNGAELMLYLIGFAPYCADIMDYNMGTDFLPNNYVLATRASPEIIEEIKSCFQEYQQCAMALIDSLIEERAFTNNKEQALDVIAELMILCRGTRVMRIMNSNLKFRPNFVTTDKLCKLSEMVLAQLDWSITAPLLNPKKLELTWRTILDQKTISP